MSHRFATHLSAALAAAGLLLAPHHAAADPQPIKVHGTGHGHGYGHGRGHTYFKPACRTIYTFGRHGTRKVVVCDAPAARHVGPPHRAPALRHAPRRYLRWRDAPPWHYGYRHHGAYTPGRATPGCNATLVSGLVGGVSGAIVGSRVGSGSGRTAATAAGTLIGALAGLGIGETLDRTCIADTLEHAPDAATVVWNGGPARAQPWQVTPSVTWQADDGRYCREFTGTATVGGEPRQVYGRACRQPDGAWEIVS